MALYAVIPRLALVVAGAAAAVVAAPLPAAADTTYNPCDTVSQLPQCVSALGPLVDVTAQWREYQPALVQPIPMGDYASDPEDLVVGFCGTERGVAAADGTPLPHATTQNGPPAGVPAPPRSQGPYCVLRFFAADFTPPCPTCHRVLIDYSGIPTGNAVSPGVDGHWAARFTDSQGLSVTLPFNGHSPNIKNLCSDKFFNPSKGARCDAVPFVEPFDLHGLSVEGDNSVYHHFPLEGRYYNGPSYLAGDGVTVPYHWVHGAYIDLDTGPGPSTLWYGIGYRGKGDPTPDTDQSYACVCEIPPVGHQAYSADYRLAPLSQVKATGGASTGGGVAGGASASSSSAPTEVSTLPNTAAPGGGAGPVCVAAGLFAAAWLRRRRVSARANRLSRR